MAGIKKFDPYVAVTFLGPFVLCLAGFAGLYVVIDFFSNIDEFLSGPSVIEVFRRTVTYYALRLPWFLARIMPVLSVVPAVICIIRLVRSNELCAMQASGVSARRICVPLVFCGIGVMFLAVANQELLVPSLRDALLTAEQRARKGGEKKIADSHVVDSNGRLLLIGSYDPNTPLPTLTDVRIGWDDNNGLHHEKQAERAFAPRPGPTWYMVGVRQFNGKNSILGNKVWKKRFVSHGTSELLKQYQNALNRGNMPLMATDTAADGRPVSYEFGSYTERRVQWPVARNVEIIYPSVTDKGRLRINMMVWAEDRWLVFGAWRFGKGDTATGELQEERLPDGSPLKSSINPSNIEARDFKKMSVMLSLGELAERASAFPSRRVQKRCWVIIWHRFAFPLANIVLLMLAVPLVIRQSADAVLVGISLAVVVTLLYMAADLVSVDLAYQQRFIWRSPVFAGTSPTILFSAIAAWLFVRMEKV